MNNKFKKNLQFLLPYILLISLIIGFFYRLFYPQLRIFVTPDFGLSDILHLNLPLKFELAESLKNNKLPFLSSLLANGFPVFEQGEIGTFNIFNLILFKFCNPIIAFNLNIIISFLLIAIFSYLYLKLIKLNELSSLFSSLSFTFSFYLITQLSHYTILQALSFFPALLFFTQKYLLTKQTKHLLLFSLILSQQIFSGSPQIVFISLLFLCFYSLYFSQKHNKTRKFFIITNLIFYVSIIIGVGISAIQLLPTITFYLLSNRQIGILNASNLTFSYPFKHLITLLNPFALGNPAIGTYPSFMNFDGSIFWENTGYIGIFALSFSLLSIIFLKKNKYIKFFWLTAFISFLLMTGKYSPIYFIYSIFPFNLFRAPSRFILIFVFSLTTLSGLFLNEIIKKYKIPILILFLILNLFDLWRYDYNYHPLILSKDLLSVPDTVKFLTSQQNNRIFSLNNEKVWNAVFLKEGWQNPNKYIYFNNSLKANINLLWNIPSFNVYQIFVTRRYQLLSNLINDQFVEETDAQNWHISDFGIKLLRENGINFVVSPQRINETNDLKLAYTTNSQNNVFYYIYELKNTLPLARLVSNLKTAATLKDYILILNDPNFNPLTTIIMEKDLPNYPKLTPTNHLEILTNDNDQLKIKALTTQSAYLVLQRSYLPGWQAYLDGKKITIYSANLNQLIVYIPAGNHQLTFIYQPKGFSLGIIISLISFIGLLIVGKIRFLCPDRNLENL